MDKNKLLQVATYAGKIMLESGAEIYRVEETISRICYSYGAFNSDCFVTPTGIFVSIYDDNATLSIVKRITSRGVDLNKIDKLNNLSRQLEKHPIALDELDISIKQIEDGKRYSIPVTLIFAALTACAFTYILGGNIYDVVSSSIIGFIIKLMSIKFYQLKINDFFVDFTCAATTAFIALILHNIGLSPNIDKTIIGSLMLLVPGLAITVAIRDIIAGDLLSGITKIGEAFLIAVAIAVGTGTVLSFWINGIGGTIK